MPNTLLMHDSRMPYHTDPRLVFHAIGGRQCEFDWLVTDHGLCLLSDHEPLRYGEQIASFVGSAAVRVSGAELTAIVNCEDIQFVWGVLSALPSGVEVDLGNLSPRPVADGNPWLWRPGVQIQHPLVHAEIVCWDGSCTLFLTRDDDLTIRFRSFFPEAIDLDEDIARSERKNL